MKKRIFDEARWHSVAFYFRKMIFVETRYFIHDQKLLIVIKCFKQWKHYLKNNQFTITVISNHNNLKYFMFITTLNKRQTKWALFFDEYDFEIKYKSSNLNSTNASSKRSNYENDVLNDTCLSTLQNKLQNIIVATTKITKNEFSKKKYRQKMKTRKKSLNSQTSNWSNFSNNWCVARTQKKLVKQNQFILIQMKNF